MKNFFSFFFVFFFPTFVTANPVSPQESNSLFTHLLEVNKEWSTFYNPEDLTETSTFNNDDQRIQMHLKLVEDYLRNNIPENLSALQIKNRLQALDHLNAYFQKGLFPKNIFHSGRQPYFIDQHETACAVGYLIIKTNYESLAKQISQENNYAYISELNQIYPDLKNWASTFGFTIEELAWIQPSYPSVIETWNQVGNGGQVVGVINKMEKFNDDKLYIAGDFSEIDGIAANSIITWDGNNWDAMGNGVTGEIHDISFTSSEQSPDELGRVFIAGNFYVNDNPNIVNVAYWENGEWNGFESSNMTGAIYTIFPLTNNRVIIGGDFEIETIDNTLIQNLAEINFNDNNAYNYDGALSVNGTISDLVYNPISYDLLISGDFTETATASSDSLINHLETQHLAYWDLSQKNWLLGFEQDLGPLSSVLIKDGYLCISAMLHTPSNLFYGISSAGLWSFGSADLLDPTVPEYIYGIESFGDHLIFYGNIRSGFSLDNNRGAYMINLNGQRRSAKFDNAVTAVKTFQEQVYFAGNFTSINDQSFSGFASTPFDDPTSNKNLTLSTNPFEIFTSLNQINIQYPSNSEDFEMQVFNLNGQLITNKILPSGSSDLSISTQGWASGIYVYQAVSKSGKIYSGKVSVMQ